MCAGDFNWICLIDYVLTVKLYQICEITRKLENELAN